MSPQTPSHPVEAAATEPSDALNCPNTGRCPLFPRFLLKASLRLWKTFYCESEYEGCARWRLSRQGLSVPPDLLPDGSLIGAGRGRGLE
jgi:hypothetical protein